jgi:hypothetical protein
MVEANVFREACKGLIERLLVALLRILLENFAAHFKQRRGLITPETVST